MTRVEQSVPAGDVAVPALIHDILARTVGPGEPGMAVGLYENGELRATASMGLANLEHGIPIGPDSVFEVASTSKQFTAATVLVLADEGVLDLDEPLVTYLPKLRLRSTITLRQCLQHVAGLPDYMTTNWLVGATDHAWMTEDHALRVLYSIVHTDFEPGTAWAYSNSGYLVAGAVVRAVTGRSLADVAKERVFEPLGMTHTFFQDDPTVVVPKRASGYNKTASGFARADVHVGGVAGPAGVQTTVEDLAGWQGFLHDGRGLGPAVRDTMLQRAVLRSGEVRPYATGIMHGKLDRRGVVSHAGTYEGYRAHFGHLPDEGIGIAVLANRSDANSMAIADEVLAAVLGDVPSSSSTARPVVGPTTADPVGLWMDPDTDQCVALRAGEQGIEAVMGLLTVQLTPVDAGVWAVGGINGAGVYFCLVDDRLALRMLDADVGTFDRVVQEAGEPPVGVYLSPELNALAVVRLDDEGTPHVRIGAAAEAALSPGPADVWVAWTGQAFTLRVERDDTGEPSALIVSAGRLRRMRFERRPDDFVAAGFPVAFGGPVLDVPTTEGPGNSSVGTKSSRSRKAQD